MSFKGKKNRYRCNKCGFEFITVDRDEGTTPFMTGCRNPIACRGWAQSAFYMIDQSVEATYEWYTPDDKETRSIRKVAVLQHVAMGGLLLRPIAQ